MVHSHVLGELRHAVHWEQKSGQKKQMSYGRRLRVCAIGGGTSAYDALPCLFLNRKTAKFMGGFLLRARGLLGKQESFKFRKLGLQP